MWSFHINWLINIEEHFIEKILLDQVNWKSNSSSVGCFAVVQRLYARAYSWQEWNNLKQGSIQRETLQTWHSYAVSWPGRFLFWALSSALFLSASLQTLQRRARILFLPFVFILKIKCLPVRRSSCYGTLTGLPALTTTTIALFCNSSVTSLFLKTVW